MVGVGVGVMVGVGVGVAVGKMGVRVGVGVGVGVPGISQADNAATIHSSTKTKKISRLSSTKNLNYTFSGHELCITHHTLYTMGHT